MTTLTGKQRLRNGHGVRTGEISGGRQGAKNGLIAGEGASGPGMHPTLSHPLRQTWRALRPSRAAPKAIHGSICRLHLNHPRMWSRVISGVPCGAKAGRVLGEGAYGPGADHLLTAPPKPVRRLLPRNQPMNRQACLRPIVSSSRVPSSADTFLLAGRLQTQVVASERVAATCGHQVNLSPSCPPAKIMTRR
jgi:hypothetical protein